MKKKILSVSNTDKGYVLRTADRLDFISESLRNRGAFLGGNIPAEPRYMRKNL